MSIYVTGDTHGGLDKRKLESKRFPEGKKLNKSDYVIVLGDFGIWQNKKAYDFIFWIDSKPFTTLFIEGNHEDYNFLKTFPIIDMFGGKVRKITDSIFQLMRGEVYVIDNYKIFSFGGARSIDRFTACRQEGIDWFPEEECSYQEELIALNNLDKHDNNVDIILTHTCSSETLKEMSKIYKFNLEDLDSQNKFFEELKDKIKYNLWLFGHMHKDFHVNEKEIAIYNKVLKLDDLLKKQDV